MKKRKFKDEKILAVLAAVESGGSIAQTCGKHQISERRLTIAGRRSSRVWTEALRLASVRWRRRAGA